MSNLNYLVVLASFAFIISSGIFIFSRGFLLTRVARTEKSSCDKFYINFDDKTCLRDDKVSKQRSKLTSGTHLNFLFQQSSCHPDFSSLVKTKACFKSKTKIVLLIIDALKYEFGIYNETISEPLPYQNKLPIIHELNKRHPDKTRLLKFYADPPTTTMQRFTS